jgi:hypothetical protein
MKGVFYLQNAVMQSGLFDSLETNENEVVKELVACQQCFSRVKRAKHIDDSRATTERAHSKIPSTDIVSNSSVRIYEIMSQYLKTHAKSTTNKADRRQGAGAEGLESCINQLDDISHLPLLLLFYRLLYPSLCHLSANIPTDEQQPSLYRPPLPQSLPLRVERYIILEDK